jgi:PBP1b-binding outer membrane lipoprotein LpoB
MKTMRLLFVLLAFLLLSGCAAFGEVKKVEAPVSKNFTDATRPLDPVTLHVMPVPASPTAFRATDKAGNPAVGFTVSDLDRLREMRAVAKANTDLATSLLDTTNAVIKERNALVDLGRLEEARANYWAEQWAAAKTEAEQAKRDKQLAEWSSKGSILLFLILSLAK